MNNIIKKRIFFSNNYPMEEARRLANLKKYPAAHLWGADSLEKAGYPVQIVPFMSSPFLKQFSKGKLRYFGDLDQQFWILKNSRKADICYFANQADFRLLSLLRRLKLFSVPICALIHHPVTLNKMNQFSLGGIDLAFCLSRKVYDQLLSKFGRSPQNTFVLEWGPDLSFPGYVSRSFNTILSAGKSNRDYKTLINALQRVPYPSLVYLAANQNIPINGNIQVKTPAEGQSQIPFDELINDFQNASVVVIPLKKSNRLCGLTELVDAMAMAKPIIMTRNEFIDIDIEEIGCGIWVNPGDDVQLEQALKKIINDPDKSREMGLAGRKYCELKCNSAFFGQKLSQVISNFL